MPKYTVRSSKYPGFWHHSKNRTRRVKNSAHFLRTKISLPTSSSSKTRSFVPGSLFASSSPSSCSSSSAWTSFPVSPASPATLHVFNHHCMRLFHCFFDFWIIEESCCVGNDSGSRKNFSAIDSSVKPYSTKWNRSIRLPWGTVSELPKQFTHFFSTKLLNHLSLNTIHISNSIKLELERTIVCNASKILSK